MIDVDHVAGIARDNAKFHRDKFKEIGDRYHLGQWKAYYRVYKRLITPQRKGVQSDKCSKVNERS